MFDAKSLIEMMMKGAAGQAPQAPQQGAGGMGGLGDLLGKVLQGGGAQPGRPQAGGGGGLSDLLGQLGGLAGGGAQANQQNAAQQGGGMGGLGDLLKQLGGAGGQGAGAPQGGGHAAPSGGLGGGLEDMLRKLQGQMGGQGGAQGGQGGQAGQAGGGGLMDILGGILGQATSGVKDGAQRMDDMTGASARMKQATGQDPADMMEQLKELIRQNQLGAGAAAGGLGAAVLGTKTGRAMAGRAMKIGGLALIGGLAYKALQNYQSGKPLIAGVAADVTEAPRGSGFETAAVTQDSSLLYIRTMIAAAAADGRIDEKEQAKLMGNLQQLGINQDAEQFLANELNNPASAEQLAQACASEEQAVQVFTAARLAIDLDTEEEHAFLVQLAQSLNIDGKLASHIDAAARAA
jgi:uncharacterized membrane protein YebE (DUF533 family)